MNALVLHAHPDDELLFAGALMLSRPTWGWTTVSLTAGIRADKYPGICLGHADEWRILAASEFASWRKSVEDLALKPDVVFTHNLMGEYGHPHHMSVHQIAHAVFSCPIWDFYVEDESTVGPQFKYETTFAVLADPSKRAQFMATYGKNVLDELTADKPLLLQTLFQIERFTGKGLAPQ